MRLAVKIHGVDVELEFTKYSLFISGCLSFSGTRVDLTCGFSMLVASLVVLWLTLSHLREGGAWAKLEDICRCVYSDCANIKSQDKFIIVLFTASGEGNVSKSHAK